LAEQLKNIYTTNYINNLALKIKEKYKDFDSKSFEKTIFSNPWNSLELKNRMRHIAITLNTFLPLSYEKQLEILKEVSFDFTSFEAMFFQDFVEVYGQEDFDNSMKALEVFTIGSSSEFAIRAFIIKYEDKTMNQMNLWAKNSNEHLRRLACEGCRPRLPWGVALSSFKKDPSKVLKIIEVLKNDKSKYVQKSVANNLNDISKDNSELVIEFVKQNLGKSKSLDWICKHASRTLLKRGHLKILELFGYLKTNHIKVESFILDDFVLIGEDLSFSFSLQSEISLGNLRVKYAIDYKKSNGTHSRKVFMISQNEIKSTRKNFTKKQTFKNMTTRKHYMGDHYLSIVINGEQVIQKPFLVN